MSTVTHVEAGLTVSLSECGPGRGVTALRASSSVGLLNAVTCLFASSLNIHIFPFLFPGMDLDAPRVEMYVFEAH